VLLLDEPLGALDLKLREEMQTELKAIQHQVGITFVFVTHDQGEALSMSDRVAVFNLGRIEQIGSPREIYESPATPFVAGFVGTSNVLDAAQSLRLLGSATMHSIRPERITIGGGGGRGDGDVEVDATVLDVQYLGSACRVRTRLDDGSSLVANVPSDGLVGVTIGGSVRLAWPRSAAFPVAMTNSSEGGER
jgi:putative spermidine/putrescine transport system ATP-binding protein